MSISVIIPVYNTADYLTKCLDSILSQTYSDLEIICVDDGSTDGSGDILDEYATEDKRIRVEHTENHGAMEARKRGITLATGEYIGFVDSDDWIEPDMYETLCEKMDTYQVDMVTSGYAYEGGSGKILVDAFEEGKYFGEKMLYLRENAFFNEKMREVGIRPVLVSKLYKTAILKNILSDIPSDLPYGEDRAITIRYLLEAKSVYILKRIFYHYLMRDMSITHEANPYCASDMNKVYIYFRSLYTHPLFTERMRKHTELYFVSMLLEGINTRMGFAASYLMWYDPDWKWKLPKGSKVVLYGAGMVGNRCYRNIVSDSEHWLQLSGWVDKNYAAISDAPVKISSPDCLDQMDYDYVVIAVRDSALAEKIRCYLTEELHVKREKIFWNPHKPLFWKYAEAAGLLEDIDQGESLCESRQGV